MLTFDEMHDILNDIIDELPEEIFRELNGGVILLEDTMVHPESEREKGELYILGQYHHDPAGLGRYITIHYGSVMRTDRYLSRREQTEHLRNILHHELVHHLESLAGERGLEKQDKEFMEEYKARGY